MHYLRKYAKIFGEAVSDNGGDDIKWKILKTVFWIYICWEAFLFHMKEKTMF